MSNISIIIHSHNYKNIVDCVKSAKLLTNNILLVGEETRSNINKELLKLGVKLIYYPNSGIVETAREFAINQAKTDWVFLLDADERITKELAEEVKSVISQSQLNQINSGSTDSTDLTDLTTHHQIPRKEIILGKKWLHYGGWWPNYQTRLINKKYFMSWPTHIHSTPLIKGKQGKLNNPLLHYSQNDFAEIVNRTIIFENMESELLFKANKATNTPTFFRKFFGELWRRLLTKLGFLDGALGIIESIYQAYSKTITYIFLYEKKLKKSGTIRPLS